jgi:hypothetical protein
VQKLECFAWAERQRNEYAAARRLLLTLSCRSPITGEGGNPIIRAGKAESHRDQSLDDVQGRDNLQPVGGLEQFGSDPRRL